MVTWLIGLIVVSIVVGVVAYLSMGSFTYSYVKIWWVKLGSTTQKEWDGKDYELGAFVSIVWWIYWPCHAMAQLGRRIANNKPNLSSE